jgi:hypothetical protein
MFGVWFAGFPRKRVAKLTEADIQTLRREFYELMQCWEWELEAVD